MFNPNRLKLARSRRGKTKKALAEGIGKSTKMVSNYESGFEVSPDVLQSIASYLDFPPKFFFGGNVDDLDHNAVSFRSLKSMKASERNSALGAARIALLLNEWIESRFELPCADIPNLSEFEPISAAELLREHWGFGQKSVSNMNHLLEGKGVRVYSLRELNRHVDAFSFWKGETPFIFLNTRTSSERSRYDAAHELGHLVLHQHGGPRGPQAEQEANRFASCFLMPEGSVVATEFGFPNLNNLIHLKRNWNVSVAALVRRLKDLSIISEWHYRTLNIEIRRKGMHRNEPNSIPRETSQILNKVFGALRDNGVSKQNVAYEISIPVTEIEDLVFGLALVGLSKPGSKISSSKPPTMTLVE